MQNTNIDLVSLVNCPVYPVTSGTDGTESKMRFGPAPLRGRILGISGRDSLGHAGPAFRPARHYSLFVVHVMKLEANPSADCWIWHATILRRTVGRSQSCAWSVRTRVCRVSHAAFEKRQAGGIFMVALCNRADHYIFILFLSSSSYFFLFFLA